MSDPPSFLKAISLTDSDIEAEMQSRKEFVRDLSLWLPESYGLGPVQAEASGCFSNSWAAPPPRNGLADVIKSLNFLAALPPASKPLRIVECRDLGSGRIYQERFRFSGGVNLSAIARNTERRIAAEQTDGTVYIEKATGNVYCSPKAAAKLIEQFPDAPIGPEPLELSWTVPMHFESSELMWTMAGRYV